MQYFTIIQCLVWRWIAKRLCMQHVGAEFNPKLRVTVGRTTVVERSLIDSLIAEWKGGGRWTAHVNSLKVYRG